ncbi:MAG TPA: hypothetical protein VM425_06040 [Myxococcota bacterium]|nr:hypothetical protein [Myxococcota bacterium]
MRQFNRNVCVIDTCSIVTLNAITLARKPLLKLMRAHFNIRVSKEVKGEINKHHKLLDSEEASRWPKFVGSVVFSPSALRADTTLRCFYTSPPAEFTEKGRGERGNARVSLEILMSKAFGHVVFLSDDINARRSFLYAIGDAFPGVDLWTTTDIVLYFGAILMKEGKCTWDDVWSALRDLRTNAANITCFDSFSKDELISLAGKHKRLLNRIHTVAKMWR